MSLNITADDAEKLKPKDKKILKEQFREYLKEIKKYVEKYKEFPLQKKISDVLNNIDLNNVTIALSVLNDEDIILKTVGAHIPVNISLRTKLNKLKNDYKYTLDELEMSEKQYTLKHKILVIKKDDKIYSAFAPDYYYTIKKNYFQEIFYKRKSLDQGLHEGNPRLNENEIRGREFLLLMKYYLDKKKENPNKEVYLDLEDFVDNYLEKYNKYTKYDDFIKNLPNFIYVNKYGEVIFKLGDKLQFYNTLMLTDKNPVIINRIKNTYDVYKSLGKYYKKILFQTYNYNFLCKKI